MASKKSMDVKLNAVLFGIRYQRRWHVLDIMGEIIDNILRNEKSPFSDKYFTKVGDQLKGKELINQDTECSLKINIDDLIFKHILDEEKEILKGKNLNWFFKSIKDYIIPKLVISYDFEQILRVGIVYYHYIPKEDISMELIDLITGNLNGETTKFNLDFHKKMAVDEALAKKGINDYRNVIHFIKSKNEEAYEIGIDYQHYFKPFTDQIEDFKTGDFLNKSKVYLRDIFYPWLLERFKNLKIEKS